MQMAMWWAMCGREKLAMFVSLYVCWGGGGERAMKIQKQGKKGKERRKRKTSKDKTNRQKAGRIRDVVNRQDGTIR